MSARPIVLVELETTLAFLGRRNRAGIPEKCIFRGGVLDTLGDLGNDFDLAVFVFGLEVEDLRAWIVGSPAAEVFAAARAFGCRRDFDTVLDAISDELGVKPGERRGVYVGPQLGRRAVAAARSWLECPDLSWVRSRLDGDLSTLLVPNVDAADAPAIMGLSSDLHGRSPLPMRIVSGDGSSLVAAMVPGGAHTMTAISGQAAQTLDADISSSVLFELAVGELTAEETEAFAHELAALPWHRPVGDRIFGTMAVGSGASLPHPPRTPHGYAMQLLPVAFGSQQPLPVPSPDPRGLCAEELATIAQITEASLQELHEPFLNAGVSHPGDSRLDRRAGSAGNESAVAHAASVLQATLEESFVYDPIAYGFEKNPAYNLDARIGTSDDDAGIVILSAHLDSCSASSGAGAAASAPGADDDASGVAAVLLAARVLAQLADDNPPRRQIRFVLFNNEEMGRGGSRDYARDLRDSGTVVAAMIHLDMIGWRDPAAPFLFDVRGPGTFRSGFGALSEQSEQIASVIHDAASEVSPGWCVQRTVTSGEDPLAARSDHTSFYMEGYPACLVSEPGLQYAGAAVRDPPVCNPCYHTEYDETIDYQLAAAVARTVIAATWKLAKH